MNTPKDATRVNFIIFALGLIAVVLSFFPQIHFWGLDTTRSFPVWIRIGLLSALLIAVLPALAEKIGEFLSGYVKSLSTRRLGAIFAMFSLVSIISFILLSSKNYLQGDGFNVMGHLIGGYAFSPTEPLDYLLHYGLAIILGGDKHAVLRSYQICAYFGGAIFLSGIFFILKNRKEIIVALSLAGTFGVFLFFYGYVESYTFRFIFMLLYLLSAVPDLRHQKVSARTVVFLILSFGFHLSSLVLAPSFVYLVWNKHRSRRSAYWALGFSFMVLVLAIINLYLFAPIRLLQIFVPVVATPNNPYSLFSADHLYDLLNVLFLSSPLFVLLSLRRPGQKSLAAFWWALVLVPALIFTVFVDPKIGAFRDWDLLSIAAAPILSFLIVGFMYDTKGALATVLPLLIFSVIHTGGWIWWNMHPEQAYRDIKEIVHNDLHYSKDYYQGYTNKAWSVIINDYFGDAEEAAKSAEERFRGAADDARNACNLASYYIAKGDSSRAAEFIGLNWKRYLNDVGALSALGSMMFSMRYYGETERMYESYVSSGGNDYRLLQELAAIKEKFGKRDSSIILYDLAYSNWANAPIGEQFGFYLEVSGLKHYDIAASGLMRILPRLPETYGRPTALLLTALKEGNYALSDSLSAAILNTLKKRQPAAGK